jgi:hypothetical protein
MHSINFFIVSLCRANEAAAADWNPEKNLSPGGP